MNNQLNSELLQALAVCAELTGTELSKAAVRVMAQDLSAYPLPQVLGALTRCRRELKGRMTIADILARLDDGRPAPEQAWAMVARLLNDENPTVVWTKEMAESFGVALSLSDDPVAARMAFKESYAGACQKARDAGAAVSWTPSLGHDTKGREAPLIEAVRLGRIPLEHAQMLLPNGIDANGMRMLSDAGLKMLTAKAGQ